MSSLAFLLIAAAPAAAEGQVTAEQALSNYRAVIAPTAELDCPRGGTGDEIVVCGKRKGEKSPYRLPLPVAREPGTRIAGEVPTGRDALAAERCIKLCPQGVGIDLGMILNAAKAIKNALEEDR